MVDRKNPLPVKRQCAVLDLPRSTFYHVPQPVSEKELAIMALIDRCHLEHPFYGSRRIRDWLEDEGHQVNRKRVQRLMLTMGLTTDQVARNNIPMRERLAADRTAGSCRRHSKYAPTFT